jgi:predicted RNase H-like nuclease (RuvC/YqgF family)
VVPSKQTDDNKPKAAPHEIQAYYTCTHQWWSGTKNFVFQTKYLNKLVDKEVVNRENQINALEYQLEEQSQSIEKGFLQGKINDLRL